MANKRYRWTSDGKVHSRKQRSGAQLRAAVQAKRDATNPLYDPSQTLAGAPLRAAANSLVDLEFGPQRKALANEAVQNTTQNNALTSKASDYFLQLAQKEQGGVDRAKAIGDMLSSNVNKIGADTQTTLQNVGAEADARAAADANLRGGGLSGGSTALAENLAAARAQAAGLTQTAGVDAANSSANYQNLADQSAQARGLRGGEIVGELTNRAATQQQDIRSRQQALEASMGPARSKATLDLRQQGFENAATASGLGLDAAKLRASVRQNNQDFTLAQQKQREVARNNRARNRLTGAQIRAVRRGQDITSSTTRRGQDMTAENQRLNRAAQKEIARQNRVSRERIANAKGKGKTLEQADARKLKSNIANAYAALTATQPPVDQDGKAYKNRIRYLQMQGAPAIVVKAARERQAGGLKLSTVSELRRLGVKVPQRWIGPYSGPIAP